MSTGHPIRGQAGILDYRLFGNLSPLPPSLKIIKGRGSVGKRGAKPLSKISSPSC